MENETKNNIKQFKKEFKNFFKKTVDNIKEENREEKNKKQDENIVKNNINIGKLFFGSFIILIGLIFLLANFNIINVDIDLFFTSLFKLWPILLILIGISFFYKKHINSMIIAIFFIFLIIIILNLTLPTYRRFNMMNGIYRIHIPNNQYFEQNW